MLVRRIIRLEGMLATDSEILSCLNGLSDPAAQRNHSVRRRREMLSIARPPLIMVIAEREMYVPDECLHHMHPRKRRKRCDVLGERSGTSVP